MKLDNKYDRLIFGTILFEVIGMREFTSAFMMENFSSISKEAMEFMINKFQSLSVIEKSEVFDSYFVKINKFIDINSKTLDILYKCGYSEYDIEKQLYSKKKVISEILNNKTYDWKDVKQFQPPENEYIIIRFVDYNVLVKETDDELYPLEDRKIAVYKNGSFEIIPPYARFDFNPLSNGSKILNSAIVTHWAEPNQEDVNEYQRRFEPKLKWKYLDITVKDDDMALDLYKALINGQLMMNQTVMEFMNDEETKGRFKLYSDIFHDLIICLDTEKIISNEGEQKDAMEDRQ